MYPSLLVAVTATDICIIGEIMREKSTIYKQRGYAHFDKKISPSQAKKFVENPNFVQHYAFYPF